VVAAKPSTAPSAETRVEAPQRRLVLMLPAGGPAGAATAARRHPGPKPSPWLGWSGGLTAKKQAGRNQGPALPSGGGAVISELESLKPA